MRKSVLKKAFVFIFILCHVMAYPAGLSAKDSQWGNAPYVECETGGSGKKEDTSGFIPVIPFDIGNDEQDFD